SARALAAPSISAPAPAAAISSLLIAPVLLLFTCRLSAIGRMPKCHRALDESEQTIKGRAGNGSDRDLRPHHVEAKAADFGRDAKAHADDRRSEEFGHDGANQ